MNSRFCVNCGVKLPIESKYCFNCGKEVYIPESIELNITEEEDDIFTDKKFLPFSERFNRCFNMAYNINGCCIGGESVLTNAAKEPISKVYTWIDSLQNGCAIVNNGGCYSQYNCNGEHEFIGGGKWGIINENGVEICPLIYDYIGYFQENGIAIVNQGGEIVEVGGNFSCNSQYYECIGGKYGFIFNTGELLSEIRYDSVKLYSDSLEVNMGARESVGVYDAEPPYPKGTHKRVEGGKWKYVNLKEKTITKLREEIEVLFNNNGIIFTEGI